MIADDVRANARYLAEQFADLADYTGACVQTVAETVWYLTLGLLWFTAAVLFPIAFAVVMFLAMVKYLWS